MATRVLVLFTRYPEAGVTKTRLIPALGAEGAAALHRTMTQLAAHILPPGGRDTFLEVRYTGGDETAMRAWLGEDWNYSPQGDGDLGERMARAVQEHVDKGATAVVLVGSDCPDLDATRVNKAFDALKRKDMVLGPAEDGGYYLAGFRWDAWMRATGTVFTDTAWGTDAVLATTLERARQAGLTAALLDPLPDVDRPEDLPVWEAARIRRRISVIIPTLNESEHVESSVASALRGTEVEVIVVDGGSTDDTVQRALALGASVIQTEPGRARQMNAGASMATGSMLLFLHADCALPKDFDGQVRRTLQEKRLALGAFSLRIDAPDPEYRRIERWANLRSRWLGLAYGDQALFMRRDRFIRLRGYGNHEFMEDVALVSKARARGRIRTLSVAVTTSARRWQQIGPNRLTLLNALAISAYVLGVPPRVIRRFYP